MKLSSRLLYFIMLINITACSFTKKSRCSVEDFGAIPNDNINDDFAFNQAINNCKNIDIPEGNFLISNVIVTDNKIIKGKGNKTILKKDKNNQGSILQLDGNNIKVENMCFIGNLFEEKGEWNHAINIRPLYKNIENIKIKNISGKNLHGDFICIGAYQGMTSNVSIKNVKLDSCYRNGISITVGKRIKIKNANLKNCGMFGIDIEIDNGSKDRISDVLITNSTMSKFVVSGEKDNVVENINIKESTIDHALFINIFPAKGVPPFYPEPCLIRHSRSVKFKKVTFKNSPYSAIKFLDSQLEDNNENFEMKDIRISNFSIKDGTALFNIDDKFKKNIKKVTILKSKISEKDNIYNRE